MANFAFLHSSGTSTAGVGFRIGPRGTHSSRTIMLDELSLIASRGLNGDVEKSVLDDNVLGKSEPGEPEAEGRGGGGLTSNI
jgi:hypothetical protein